MQQMLRKAAAISMAVWLGACALSEDKVAVDYVAVEGTEAVAGASAVTLGVSATDQRAQYRDRIGTKKNGYGMEMARIVATNDVVDLVRGGVEREFKAQGFAIGPGGLKVSVELQNFYNNFRYGMTWTAAGEVAFSLKVRDAKGALLYSQLYDATGIVKDLFLASGVNAKDALQKGLSEAIKKVVEDKALQQALLATIAPKSAPNRKPGA